MIRTKPDRGQYVLVTGNVRRTTQQNIFSTHSFKLTMKNPASVVYATPPCMDDLLYDL